MNPLDKRLLRRARAARRLLVTDVALGLGTALLVVVQASLIAEVITRAFDGASLREVGGKLVGNALHMKYAEEFVELTVING